jgi:hypothetical protein
MSRAWMLIGTILIAGPLQSQTLFVGVRAGQSVATQSFGNLIVDNPNAGLAQGVFPLPPEEKRIARPEAISAGLSALYEFRPWFAVEGELLYVEKGMQQEPQFSMRIDYVEVPLLARLSTSRGLFGVHPFVHGGVAPAMEVSCRTFIAQMPLGNGQIEPMATSDCSPWRNRSADLAVPFGFGVVLRRTTFQLNASVRRTYGIRNIEQRFARYNDTRAFYVGFVGRLK